MKCARSKVSESSGGGGSHLSGGIDSVTQFSTVLAAERGKKEKEGAVLRLGGQPSAPPNAQIYCHFSLKRLLLFLLLQVKRLLV